MKFLTDDDSFGVQLTPVRQSEFFRMRILLGGAVLGDYEPAIVWQDLQALSVLNTIEDSRLNPVQDSAPSVIRDAIISDDELQERCRVQLGESFDPWLVRGYIYSGYVVLLHARTSALRRSNLSLSLASADEYHDVMRSAKRFYSENLLSQD